MAIKQFPGLIDVHVHLREPGATQKEDFKTGSRAALAGGITHVLDMPNNPEHTISIPRLEQKIKLSDEKAGCDVGFHYGTNGVNLESFKEAGENPRVFGLKVYMNHTTGEMLISITERLDAIFQAWEAPKPILVHAEGETLSKALWLAGVNKRKLHLVHISTAEEVEMVRTAKSQGMPVTAGVCPHHLFMTEADVETMGVKAMMRPPLGTQEDQDALWKAVTDGTIDLVETDHAPHLIEEKESGLAKFGIPGLETSLGLMLSAVHEGRLKEEDVIRLMYDNPKKHFNIPTQENTHVELDPEESYVMQPPYESKCGWSPFEGRTLFGKPKRVVLRGKTVYESK